MRSSITLSETSGIGTASDLVGGRLRRIPAAGWAWLAHVILIHSVAAVTVALSPGRDAFRSGQSGVSRYLVSPLALWDGGWYGQVVEDGYRASEESAAFWPLYPAFIDLVSSISGLSPDACGILISGVAFLGALIALARMITSVYGEQAATRGVWLLALNPVAFYFSAVYTESLFLLVSVGAILCARRAHWTDAALLALLATLTRSTGMLVLLPLGVILLKQIRHTGRNPIRPAIQLLAAGLGPIAFAAHLQRVWGDALLMLHTQEHWNREFALPWQSLWTGFRRLELTYVTGRQECFDGVRAGDWPLCRDALRINIDALSDDLAVAAAAVAILLLPVMIRRLRAADSLYGIALLLVVLSNGIPDDALVSLPRYLLVAYPFTVALAIVLRSRRQFLITLGLSAICLGWLLSVFARAWFVA